MPQRKSKFLTVFPGMGTKSLVDGVYTITRFFKN